MASVNGIVEGSWYTVPPMECFISKELVQETKIVAIWRHKNWLNPCMVMSSIGCYQSEWVAPREYIWYDGTGGTLHKQNKLKLSEILKW